jgi:hypothetical protein
MTDEFSNKPNHLLDLIKPIDKKFKLEDLAKLDPLLDNIIRMSEDNDIEFNMITMPEDNEPSYDKECVESTDNKKVTFKLDSKGLMPVKEYVTIGKDEYEQFKHKYSKSKAKLKQIKRILNIKHV